jgi:hypothetical protein
MKWESSAFKRNLVNLLAPLMITLVASTFFACKKDESPDLAMDTAALDAAALKAVSTAGVSVPVKLALLNDDGAAVQVDVANSTVVYLGSWCPYSHQLISTLNDNRVKPFLKDKTLVFLFDRNEWPVVRRKLIEAGLSEAAADAKIEQKKESKGDTPLADMTFLDSLPGQHYYAPDGSKLRGEAVPGVFDVMTGVCSLKPLEFFPDHGIPMDQFLPAYIDHSPDPAVKKAMAAKP